MSQMKTTTFTVRCTQEEKDRWQNAAGDMKFNSWVKSALNVAAAGENAGARFVPAPKPKKKSSGCAHQGYEHSSFCYRCQNRI